MKPYKTITLRLDAAHYVRLTGDRPGLLGSRSSPCSVNSLWASISAHGPPIPTPPCSGN